MAFARRSGSKAGRWLPIRKLHRPDSYSSGELFSLIAAIRSEVHVVWMGRKHPEQEFADLAQGHKLRKLGKHHASNECVKST